MSARSIAAAISAVVSGIATAPPYWQPEAWFRSIIVRSKKV